MRIAIVSGLMLLAWLLPASADWEPDPDDELQLRASETVQQFREQQSDRLQRYFDEAYAYAVYPGLTRGGFIFGAAYGRGLVVEAGELVGYTSQWRGSLGIQLGVQRQAQIIFFRDRKSLEAFKRGAREFSSQASAAVATVGGAVDPAWLPDVAIFSLTRGGLMLEATVGSALYRFQALP